MSDDQGAIGLGANQLGQIWDLLFGECGQVEEGRGVSKVR